MNNFNIDLRKLKPQADIVTILIILFASAIVGIYLNYHLIYIIPIFLILYILILGKVIFGKWNKTINIPPAIFLLILITITYIVANLYSYYFFSINKDQFSNIFNLMITFNFEFLKMLMLSTATLVTYIFSSLFIGQYLIRKFKLRLSLTAFYFLSITAGLSILGTIFFTLASFGYLNLYTAGTLMSVITLLNIHKLKAIFFKSKNILITKIKLDINILKLLFSFTLFLYLSTIIVSSLRSFIYAPDGLRAYLSLTRYLAENNSLPYTTYLPNAPFFTEILISPAYMVGQISTSIFTLNFLSLLYIVGFYLIAKDQIRSKISHLVLIPIILFPPFMQILTGEYKIDIFFTLFSSSVFYTLYKYIKEKEIKFAYLSILFMSVAFLIKMTALFYIAPFCLYIGIKIIFSEKMLKEKLYSLVIIAILFALPIAPWITLYRVELPNIGLQGLGLSKYSKEVPTDKDIHSCLFEIQTYEEKTYTNGFDKSIISYLKTPFYYIKATGTRAKSFSLLDAGLFTFVSFFIFISWTILKRKNIIKNNSIKTLVVLIMSSLIPWFIMAPIYIWYVAPMLILLTIVAYISILDNTNIYIRQFLETLTNSFFGIYILTLVMIHALAIYFPTGLSAKTAVSIFKDQKSSHQTYLNNFEISEIVNKNPKSKILFTSAATFANVNFFIDNYYDRATYLDYYTKTFDEKEVEKILKKHNINYIVINNIAVDSDMECLSKSQKIAKESVTKFGKIILETSAFTLLEVR